MGGLLGEEMKKITTKLPPSANGTPTINEMGPKDLHDLDELEIQVGPNGAAAHGDTAESHGADKRSLQDTQMLQMLPLDKNMADMVGTVAGSTGSERLDEEEVWAWICNDK